MSTVSVIIPCYNYAHFLRECVESVVSQAGVEVHVLIIDDASADNTAEVAAELLAHHPGVEYRRHEKNCGHIATYNEGLAWASGDYTVLLSADDLLTPGVPSACCTADGCAPRSGIRLRRLCVVQHRSTIATTPAPICIGPMENLRWP